MKKALITLFVLSIFAGTAYAKHSIVLNGRMEYQTIDNDSKNSGIPNTQGFNMKNNRFMFAGDINDELTYAMIVQASGSFGTANTIDGTTGSLVKMSLTQKFSDMFSATFGKHYGVHGGYEHDASPQDLYLTSLAYGDLDFWVVGASLKAKMKNHTFRFMLNNADRDTDSAGNASQKNVSYAVNWHGNFAGMIMPRLGFHTRPKADGKKQTALTSALRFDMKSFFGEVEYYAVTKENETTVNKDDENTSLIAKFQLQGDNFRPFVKYFMDEQKVTGTKTLERTGLVAALQYYPVKDQNFRYHLVYTSLDTDFVSAATKDTTVNTITLGLKYNFKAF